MSLKYENYIFDLYGTLIDIRTDENKPEFWEKIAEFYACYGADYSAFELHTIYVETVHRMEQELADREGKAFPEIQLEYVFAWLLINAPKKHEARLPLYDGRYVEIRGIMPEKEREAKENKLPGIEQGPDSTRNVVQGNVRQNPAYFDFRGNPWNLEQNRVLMEELVHSAWVRDLSNLFRVLSREKIEVYPGTKEIFEEIKSEGGKIYLLSNAQALFTIPEIERMGLMPYFDGVYISSDKRMKKPQPEFMQLLIDEQQLDKTRSVMIGNDVEADVGVAVRNGMQSVFLNTDELTKSELKARLDHTMEGYDKSLLPRVIMSGDIRELLDE